MENRSQGWGQGQYFFYNTLPSPARARPNFYYKPQNLIFCLATASLQLLTALPDKLAQSRILFTTSKLWTLVSLNCSYPKTVMYNSPKITTVTLNQFSFNQFILWTVRELNSRPPRARRVHYHYANGP